MNAEKKSILIVDDEEMILRMLSNILGRDHTVVTFLDPAQAVSAASGVKFDLVITDFRMNGMNGIELIRQISALQPDTEFIILTGEALDPDAIPAGVSFLSKPFELSALLAAVQQALAPGVIG